MRVVIRFTEREPPAGDVGYQELDGEQTLAFTGWLGLLRALYDLLKQP